MLNYFTEINGNVLQHKDEIAEYDIDTIVWFFDNNCRMLECLYVSHAGDSITLVYAQACNHGA